MQIPMERQQPGRASSTSEDYFWRELAITFFVMFVFVSAVYYTFGLTAAAIALSVPMSLSLVYGIR